MSTIDFYFEFAPPYSYVAAKGIAAIAAKHDRAVRRLPVDISKIWRRHGVLDAYGSVRALKREFIRKDSRMVAASRGIAMATHRRPLANAELARLAVHYLNARNCTDGAAFGMAAWDRFFEQGADISIEEELPEAGHEHISLRVIDR
jgi:2-hydroxychromene-2-carboxylate isomerase